MILQRYTFGSKSQRVFALASINFCCLWYCKDIHLEANHNKRGSSLALTISCLWYCKDIHLEANHNKLQCNRICRRLLMILQRYTFGSKSQHNSSYWKWPFSCLWYCKDIHLEVNHNSNSILNKAEDVAYDIAKIGNFSQMATP